MEVVGDRKWRPLGFCVGDWSAVSISDHLGAIGRWGWCPRRCRIHRLGHFGDRSGAGVDLGLRHDRTTDGDEGELQREERQDGGSELAVAVGADVIVWFSLRRWGCVECPVATVAYRSGSKKPAIGVDVKRRSSRVGGGVRPEIGRRAGSAPVVLGTGSPRRERRGTRRSGTTTGPSEQAENQPADPDSVVCRRSRPGWACRGTTIYDWRGPLCAGRDLAGSVGSANVRRC